MKKAFPVYLVLLVLLPVWQMVQAQAVLTHGKAYRFETEPVDPADAFRGRYIALGFKAAQTEVERDFNADYGRKFYAVLGVDENGFGKIERLESRKPSSGDYVKVRGLYLQTEDCAAPSPDKEPPVCRPLEKPWFRVQFPWDRFYMNEKAAPKAEEAYREALGNQKKTWAVIRVRGGASAVENVYLDGQPIQSYLSKET